MDDDFRNMINNIFEQSGTGEEVFEDDNHEANAAMYALYKGLHAAGFSEIQALNLLGTALGMVIIGVGRQEEEDGE